jgi:SAM-dependent methyltransferase
MATEGNVPTEERRAQLLQHLGIRRAHIAAVHSGPDLPNYAGFVRANPEAIGSLTLFCPREAMDADLLGDLASRLLLIAGDQGLGAENARRSAAIMPATTLAVLHNYFLERWRDVAAARPAEVTAAMQGFLARHPMPAVSIPESDGEVAGISYRVRGSGPPLVLFPLALAPSQWEPILPSLAGSYCTITVGGPWLSPIRALESRMTSRYIRLVQYALEEAELRPGDTVLDVGCGPGTVARWLARRTAGANPIVAVDISPYMLREATALAGREALDGISFREANAEALAFADGSFDSTMACTVLEEVDADRVLGEMVRVTKPGGRVIAMVRAVDRPLWIDRHRPELETTPERIKESVEEKGCGDASLYRRFHEAGLSNVLMCPQWSAAEPQPDGTVIWEAMLHCAIGTRP